MSAAPAPASTAAVAAALAFAMFPKTAVVSAAPAAPAAVLPMLLPLPVTPAAAKLLVRLPALLLPGVGRRGRVRPVGSIGRSGLGTISRVRARHVCRRVIAGFRASGSRIALGSGRRRRGLGCWFAMCRRLVAVSVRTRFRFALRHRLGGPAARFLDRNQFRLVFRLRGYAPASATLRGLGRFFLGWLGRATAGSRAARFLFGRVGVTASGRRRVVVGFGRMSHVEGF
jgi:hypothetical protein